MGDFNDSARVRSQAPVIFHGDHYYGTVHANSVGQRVMDTPKRMPQNHRPSSARSHRLAVSAFDHLTPHMVFDALYNSRKREEEHASTCLPGTRTRILQIILDWANGAGHPVCWLRGPAGTGKSTIAHTSANILKDILAASFFFGRKTGDREDITKLVTTLAYQIAQSIPSTESPMQSALEADKTIPFQRLEDQFSSLLVNPLAKLGAVNRSLVVIDGLDECSSREGISELIRLLADAIEAHALPFRFLLASRPEPDIEAAFELYMSDRMALWVALEDSRKDVRQYLKTHLQQIRDKFSRIMRNEPKLWPPEPDLERMLTKSDGLFIHAATAAKYIGDGKGSPQKKLQTVLQMHKGVDPLYAQVISDARECENFDTVMGCLMHLAEPVEMTTLSQLVGLDIADIRMALDRCHSILTIPDDNDKPIQPYHASLRDFLTSEERSRSLFCAPSQSHVILLRGCMADLTSACANNGDPLTYACLRWSHHASVLLSDTCAIHPYSLPLRETAEQIQLRWVMYWLTRAVSVASAPTLKVKLPSSPVGGIICIWRNSSTDYFWKQMSEGHQALDIKLRGINLFLDVRL